MKVAPLIFILAMPLLIFVPAAAQDDWHFVDETSFRLPDIPTLGTRMDAGDVDGDGDLDVLVACDEIPFPYSPGYEQIFINESDGYFLQENDDRLPLINDFSDLVLLMDVDSDQDLDFLVGNAAGDTSYISINDGTGYFTRDDSRWPYYLSSLGEADYGDVDNDGDIDMCTHYGFRTGFLLLNDGSGHFVPAPERTPVLQEPLRDLFMTDFDEDLDLDILLVIFAAPPRLLINDGTGFFVDDTEGRLNVDFALYGGVSDVDNDDDYDIFILPAAGCILLINDGQGYFTDESQERLPYLPDAMGIAVATGDANNDGAIDCCLANSDRPTILLVNTGGGYFENQTGIRMPLDSVRTWDAILADFDSDGDADYFRVGDGRCRNSIYINTLNAPDSFAPDIKNGTVFPEYDTLPGPYRVKLVAKDGVSMEYQLRVSVHYSTDGIDFLENPMRYTGGYMFTGTIPQVDSGQTVYYYYTASDNYGNTSSMPQEAPDSVFSFTCLSGRTVIEDGDSELPRHLDISAYPNPFNSRVTIKYVLPSDGTVSIGIFNVSGQRVERIISQNMAAGQHKITWDASSFPSGHYSIVIEQGNRSESARIILVK